MTNLVRHPHRHGALVHVHGKALEAMLSPFKDSVTATLHGAYYSRELETVFELARLVMEQVKARQCCPADGVMCLNYNPYASDDRFFSCRSIPEAGIKQFAPDPENPCHCANYRPLELEALKAQVSALKEFDQRIEGKGLDEEGRVDGEA